MIWLRRVWLIAIIPLILFLFLCELVLSRHALKGIRSDIRYWLRTFKGEAEIVKVRQTTRQERRQKLRLVKKRRF